MYIFKDQTKLGKLCGIKNILSPKNYDLRLPALAPTHQQFLRSLVEVSQYPLKTR